MQNTTPKEQSTNPDWRTILVAFLSVVLFASAFVGIRVGLGSYSPQSVALLRYITASVVLAIFALLGKIPLPDWRDLPGLAFCGLMGFTVYNIALNMGEIIVPAGTASLVIASSPIFVALLASIFQKEKTNLRIWIGIMVSFVGVAFISIEPGEKLSLSPSVLLILLASVSAAIYTVSQKPLLKKYSPFQFVAYAIWAGTILLLPFLPGLLREVQTASLMPTLAVVYMGIFPGVLGYASWSYVLSRMPASSAGSFMYLTPAVTIFIAWIWLGEVPGLRSIFGGLLVLLGVFFVMRSKAAKQNT